VCAMLAVLKAGASFTVVDDAYPAARIHTCLEMAGARRVLLLGSAQRRSGTSVPLGIPRTHLSTSHGEMAVLVAEYRETTPRAATADSIAYLTFTSGSTGTPKCVATGHAPLPHFVGWHQATFGLGPDDHFSLLSGISHDPLLRDIFTPLSIGATLHVPDQGLLSDPEALFPWLGSEGITVCRLTPALGQIILAGAPDERLPRLRWLFWGGDVLRSALVTAFLATAPHARQVNFYGTAETPQAVGYLCIDRADQY